ncbi:MAG: hypothetical protein ACM3ZA_08535 [Bacillota bacterium]
MRYRLWLAPLLAAAVLAGCSSGAPAGPPQEAVLQAQNAAGAESGEDQAARKLDESAAARQVAPAVRTGSVSMDLAKLNEIQAQVDQGHTPGYLDPEDVIRSSGMALGLSPATDVMHLERLVHSGEGSGTGEAYFYVRHDGREYVVQLIQPVRTGPTGIWALNSIRDIGVLEENERKLAVLNQYFQALAGRDYDTAYRLMSRRFRQGLAGPEALANNSVQEVEAVERVAWASPGPDTMYVEIRLKLSTQNRSSWADGDNGRFASFVEENGDWRIDGLATSP